MDTPSKRALTEDLHASNNASNAFSRSFSTDDPDITARLRNIGSRVRKNVTEGYNTNRFTRTHGPSRAQSAGSVIFQSSNDTLLDVFTSSSMPSSSQTRKRRVDESGVEEDEEPVASSSNFTRRMSVDNITPLNAERPIKPLRKSAFSKTQSLPTAFGTNSVPHNVPSVTEEEEDWSVEPGAFTGRDEPMSF